MSSNVHRGCPEQWEFCFTSLGSGENVRYWRVNFRYYGEEMLGKQEKKSLLEFSSVQHFITKFLKIFSRHSLGPGGSLKKSLFLTFEERKNSFVQWGGIGSVSLLTVQ